MTLQLIADYKAENPGTEIVYQCAPGIAQTMGNLMKQAGVDHVIGTDTTMAVNEQYNLIGYPLAEGYPEKPMKKHLLQYFADELGIRTPGRGLTLLKPERHDKYCTVHVQAGWSQYKNWDFQKWEMVCTYLREQGIKIYQIGGEGDHRLKNVDGSWCGRSFDENLEVLGGARVHMGVDSWTNHATNINWLDARNGTTHKVPAVILWGSTQPSAAGYDHNTNIHKGLPCQPCFKEDPKISRASRGPCQHPPNQTYDSPRHECMARIQIIEVIRAAMSLWERDV